MSKMHWLRMVGVVILGMAVGCGGGGDGDGDDFPGEFWTAIDINTSPCGPPVNEVMGGDITDLGGGRFRVDIYVESVQGCGMETWTLYGTQTGPTSGDMDDVAGAFLCALEADYGYGTFDVTNAELTELRQDVYRIEGDFLAEYGGGDCAGSIFITMDGS